MTHVIYELTVKESSYIDNTGQTQNRYLTVGSVLQKPDGSKFILLKRSFNPAGIANPDHKDSIVVSLFKPKGAKQTQAPNPQPKQKPLPSIEEINSANLDEFPF